MKLINKFKLNKNLALFFVKNKNIFILKTLLGISFFYLPSYFFFKIDKNKISFLFLNKFFFKSFISHFFTIYSQLNYFYMIRLRIRGLGYQIYKLSKTLFSFHYNYINFYYLFLPKNIISHWYKKRLIMLSNNLSLLNLIFNNILLLKKLGSYRLLGIKYPRQITILKKGGKSKSK